MIEVDAQELVREWKPIYRVLIRESNANSSALAVAAAVLHLSNEIFELRIVLEEQERTNDAVAD